MWRTTTQNARSPWSLPRFRIVSLRSQDRAVSFGNYALAGLASRSCPSIEGSLFGSQSCVESHCVKMSLSIQNFFS
jgi:hypothetical protein